jgi:hypothetical protein
VPYLSISILLLGKRSTDAWVNDLWVQWRLEGTGRLARHGMRVQTVASRAENATWTAREIIMAFGSKTIMCLYSTVAIDGSEVQ